MEKKSGGLILNLLPTRKPFSWKDYSLPRFKDIPQFTRSANYEVNISWDYLEDWLNHLDESYGLELEPDFQRSHVWDDDKRIKYVEFILRGGKSSKNLYFNCKGWMSNATPGRVVLVDGLQRLTAVRKFINNEIKAFGHHYKEYTDSLRVVLHSFTVFVNDLETRKEVLQWYLDLNSGGVVHTEEELEKVRELLKNEK
jgi:hypothetical protein